MPQKLINGYPFISYHPPVILEDELEERAKTYFHWLNQRRTVRDFSEKPIPQSVIEHLILSASTAPSGANKQPWTFCAVQDASIKRQIREAAEKEEFESYTHRMSQEWLDDLKPLQTDWQKSFLEIAPWLIVVFAQSTGPHKEKHYYVQESVGLACGFFLTAIHQAGLVALTHTPSPMNFLKKILQRPDYERPFLLIPVGYPADETWIPAIQRKSLHEISCFY
ncbi:MAG: nitroreductase family protein [Spirosomataceae bacterium]